MLISAELSFKTQKVSKEQQPRQAEIKEIQVSFAFHVMSLYGHGAVQLSSAFEEEEKTFKHNK